MPMNLQNTDIYIANCTSPYNFGGNPAPAVLELLLQCRVSNIQNS
jgi:hypothetical protein